LKGLREGFWPCHSGEATPPLDSETRRRIYSLSPPHRHLVAKQVEKEVGLGWISPGLDSFPEDWGVNYSPRFVLEKEGRKPRIIDDYSASKLNDGILKKEVGTI
jgi:hypothetical protein